MSARQIYHFAASVNEHGAVRALCSSAKTRPRMIDLRRASWTRRPQLVSCQRCRALLTAQRRAAEGQQ